MIARAPDGRTDYYEVGPWAWVIVPVGWKRPSVPILQRRPVGRYINTDVRGTLEAKHNGWRGWLSGRSVFPGYWFSRDTIESPDPAVFGDAARRILETGR